MKRIVLMLVLLFPSVCFSQKTFPLHTSIPDKTLVCLNKDAAIALAEAVVSPVMLQQLYENFMNAGQCFNVEGMMVYAKKVYETDRHWFVYEMKFGGVQGYVLTDMKSEGTEI